MFGTLASFSRLKIKNKRVLVRADFDVGMSRAGLESKYRIRANFPTLDRILKSGGLLRLMAHRGRPAGRRDPRLTLRPLTQILSERFGRRVIFVPNPLDPRVFERFSRSLDVLLFENLRFWEEEEKNDPDFAHALSRWGDFYVNEAFAASHRAHASIIGVSSLLPSCAGLHTEKEIAALAALSGRVRRPYVAILGGAKLETKLPLIRKFFERADRVLVGGALANTLLASRGTSIGRSAVDSGIVNLEGVLQNKKLVLPSDVVAARSRAGGGMFRVCLPSEVRRSEFIVDIGPATQKQFCALISHARTIVWNGPVGICEAPAFCRGTKKLVAAVGSAPAYKVIGGGDTLAVLEAHNLLTRVAAAGRTHISTGGGAMLEFLAGKKLPGIEALKC